MQLEVVFWEPVSLTSVTLTTLWRCRVLTAGIVGGVLAGAIGANVLEHAIGGKKKKEKKHKKEKGSKHHKRRGSHSSSSSSSSDSD